MGSQDEAGEAFAERFLETGTATVADIDELIQRKAREGLQLEFKGGDWLKGADKGSRGDPAKPGPRLCKYVAGFANTAGGVLVVGIDEPNDVERAAGQRDFAKNVNPQTCRDWAATPDELKRKVVNALHNVTLQLPFPPRVVVVEHPVGMVLVVGVERAPSFFDCHEAGGQPVHYLRTLAGTAALPDLLVADMVLGRRSRPQFELEVGIRHESSDPDKDRVTLSAGLTIRNAGLVWVEGLRAGVVFVTTSRAGVQKVSTSIMSWIDAAESASLATCIASEANGRWGELPPFATVSASATIDLPHEYYRWSFATYVVARGHPPQWWETSGRLEVDVQSRRIRVDPGYTTTRCARVRPRVTWGVNLDVPVDNTVESV